MILEWSKVTRSGKNGRKKSNKNKSERSDQMEQENAW